MSQRTMRNVYLSINHKRLPTNPGARYPSHRLPKMPP